MHRLIIDKNKNMLNTDFMEKTDIYNINKENAPCIYDSWENHLGAYFQKDGKIVFKLFTFNDVKSVKLEIKIPGEQIKSYNMNLKRNGIWEIILEKGSDIKKSIIPFEKRQIATVQKTKIDF